MGESLSGEARLFPAGFGVDGFDLLLPNRLARSGVSMSIGKSTHDRKGKLAADADTYFLRFKKGHVRNNHHGIEELKTHGHVDHAQVPQ